MKDVEIIALAGDKHIIFRVMHILKKMPEFRELAKHGEIHIKLVHGIRDADPFTPFLPEDFAKHSWEEMLIVCGLKSKYDE